MTKFLFGMAAGAVICQKFEAALAWSAAALLCFALWPNPKKEAPHD